MFTTPPPSQGESTLEYGCMAVNFNIIQIKEYSMSRENYSIQLNIKLSKIGSTLNIFVDQPEDAYEILERLIAIGMCREPIAEIFPLIKDKYGNPPVPNI